HAGRCHDEGLVRPGVGPRQHGYACGLPLGHLLLDVIDDEADMVHHRPWGATFSLLGPEVQVDVDAGEHHQRVAADHEHLGAHALKEFLVCFHILRDDVPVTHGHAGVVEWGRLRGRWACGQRCCEHETCEYGRFHQIPPC